MSELTFNIIMGVGTFSLFVYWCYLIALMIIDDFKDAKKKGE